MQESYITFETGDTVPGTNRLARMSSKRAARLKVFEPATQEQQKQIPLRLPLVLRDLAILLALLFYRILTEAQIEWLLFREPGSEYSRASKRLFKLFHHGFVKRIQVDGEIAYLLLARGRDAIAEHLKIDRSQVDWTPDHNRPSNEHFSHLVRNNWARIYLYLSVKYHQSVFILDQAPLASVIRQAGKSLLEVGWSRERVWEKIDYLVYTQAQLGETIADPEAWLIQAVVTNRKKPTGFDAKTFVSPLTAVDADTEGFVLRDWLTDRDLGRLNDKHKLKVEYTPLGGTGKRSGVVEMDDEFELATPWQEKGKRQSFILMGEYDNQTRPLEHRLLKDSEEDDSSMAKKIAKLVAMMEDKVYTQVRGKKLDKIFFICFGGPESVEHRLQLLRKCGARHAFFITSLQALQNPAYTLTAPLWRKAADSEERYYPLIGRSQVEIVEDRLQQTLRKQLMQRLAKTDKYTKEALEATVERVVARLLADLRANTRQKAKQEFIHRARLDLTERHRERLQRVPAKIREETELTLLKRAHEEATGLAYEQALAIYAETVVEAAYTETLDRARERLSPSG